MIRASREEVDDLLAGWRQDGLWLGAAVFFGENSEEEHKFWAHVSDTTLEEDELSLDGKHAFVSVPLKNSVFEYSELGEAPERLRLKFSAFSFCLTIRSNNVVAFLFGTGPKEE